MSILRPYSNVRRFLTQGTVATRQCCAHRRTDQLLHTTVTPSRRTGNRTSVTADAAPCPWQKEHYLARIALKARTIDKARRTPTNLVFLLDVSGSMQAANKLPLVKQAMTMLSEELNERDRIAIVTYAGDAGVKLISTPEFGPGPDRLQAIDTLQSGGSTNGAAGNQRGL